MLKIEKLVKNSFGEITFCDKYGVIQLKISHTIYTFQYQEFKSFCNYIKLIFKKNNKRLNLDENYLYVKISKKLFISLNYHLFIQFIDLLNESLFLLDIKFLFKNSSYETN